MKARWEVKPLGEVCELYQPKTISKKDMTDEGAYPVYGANGVIGRYSEFNHEKTQLVVGCRGACGTVHITAPKSWITGNSMVVAPKNEDCDLTFLSYFFQLSEVLDGVVTGAAQPQITRKSLSPVLVAIPPLEEQKRIVAVLDAAFEGLTRAKENAETNLQNARELFESALDKCLVQDAIDWPEHELGALGKLTTGGTPKSADADQYGDAIPFIKPGYFQVDGSVAYEGIGLSEAGMLGARVIPENSALMVCIGATIGKSGFCVRDITTNQQINALTPNEKVLHYFVYLHFITPTFQKQVIANSGQATLPIINKSKWGKLKIRVPASIAEQQDIVDRMREMRVQVDLASEDYRAKLTDIADLRQSLLQKAFAGDLT